MGWFQRDVKGITTDTKDKKDMKEGLWYKCPECSKIVSKEDHTNNLYVCDACEYHERINSREYFAILFDNQEFTEIAPNLYSADPLKFVDTQRYTDRIKSSQKKSGVKDAMSVGVGKVDGESLVVACFNFNYIGGSMGAVVGEKITRAADYSLKHHIPLMIISKSGGARMMEAAYSLMQLAKTSAKLSQLADAGIPYLSFLTDPTTGGVTASFAMLGDVNFAEPRALIGFAGPRVIRETIKRDLPEGFQTSEFVLEHGFLDYIVHRRDLKKTIAQQLRLFRS